MLTTNTNSGFHIQFANGYKVSVQFGPANYCEHHYNGQWDAAENDPSWTSKDAEVAIFGPDGEFLQLTQNDTVVGWQSADAVAQWIAFAAAGTVPVFPKPNWD